MNKIVNRFTDKIICKGKESVKELAEKFRANLSVADLSRANLSGVNLSWAGLYGANLSGANLEFSRFPSIGLLSSIYLGTISDNLALELMRRDADGHPYPERFDEWAKGGDCPYQNEERFWLFNEKKIVWKPGKPQMSDKDLIIAICRETGWKIRNYKI